MDITLFINQVNQLLQTAEEHTTLDGVCDLLRLHTCATITLFNNAGQVLREFLHSDITDGQYKISLGLIALCRDDRPFDETEILAAKMTLSICTILQKNKDAISVAEKKRRMESVRSVINTLSFSELEAATHVLKALSGQIEGLLVAGHIADTLGFTRSVVTGALRKLEGAGLIETRSLGMKGTYIRVKDVLLTDELAKL